MKECPNCGEKIINDSFRFCPECGFNLTATNSNNVEDNVSSKNNIKQNYLQIPQKYEKYEIAGESKCCNCKENTLIHLHKNNILLDDDAYFCTNCGLTLEKSGYEYKLADISDKTNRMWRLYQNEYLNSIELKRIADGGLSNKDELKIEEEEERKKQEELEARKKYDLQLALQAITGGRDGLMPVPSPVVLKRNEEAYVSIPNITLSEPRSVRVSNRSGYGTSYRVTKGFSVYASQGQTTSVSHDEIMPVDVGQLVLTNKRLVFVGYQKSVNMNLNKILSVNAFNDGISVEMENRKKTQYFSGFHNFTVNFSIDGRYHLINVDTYLFRQMILGRISRL